MTQHEIGAKERRQPSLAKSFFTGLKFETSTAEHFHRGDARRYKTGSCKSVLLRVADQFSS